MMNVSDIRNELARKYRNGIFTDDGDNQLVEITGASFVADEPTIFGKVNEDYVQREFHWYATESLNVNDIPGKCPAIWDRISSSKKEINSNYGYLCMNEGNHSQSEKALNTLLAHRASRRALMIYQRPTMHEDFNRDGMCDFICTNAVQYLIRNGRMEAVVQMRSNDAWAGYRNDVAWQECMLAWMVHSYNARIDGLEGSVSAGPITWQVGSLHVYHRQFYLLKHFNETGVWNISKADFDLAQKLNP